MSTRTDAAVRDEMRWVENLIQEGKAAQAKNPMTLEEMIAEDDRLLRYGVKRAKELGIKTDLASATRIIHELRSTESSLESSWIPTSTFRPLRSAVCHLVSGGRH